MCVCTAAAGELGMEAADFTPAGSDDPDGFTNSQGLYVQASCSGERGSLWWRPGHRATPIRLVVHAQHGPTPAVGRLSCGPVKAGPPEHEEECVRFQQIRRKRRGAALVEAVQTPRSS